MFFKYIFKMLWIICFVFCWLNFVLFLGFNLYVFFNICVGFFFFEFDFLDKVFLSRVCNFNFVWIFVNLFFGILEILLLFLECLFDWFWFFFFLIFIILFFIFSLVVVGLFMLLVEDVIVFFFFVFFFWILVLWIFNKFVFNFLFIFWIMIFFVKGFVESVLLVVCLCWIFLLVKIDWFSNNCVWNWNYKWFLG